MEVLLIAMVCLTNLACFIVGAKVGQAASKGETIETPTVNPMQAYREHQAKKEAEHEKSVIDTIMRNIDNYDGTSANQEDVPRW